MPTRLIHVFPTPVYTHTLYFVNEILSSPPFSVLTLTLMTIFIVGIYFLWHCISTWWCPVRKWPKHV